MLTEYTVLFMSLPGMGQAKAFLECTGELLLHWADNLRQFCVKLLCNMHHRSSSSNQSNYIKAGSTLPTAYANNMPSETPISPLHCQSDTGTEPSKSPPFSHASSANNSRSVADSSLQMPVSPGKQLWANALRSFKMHLVITSPHPRKPH